MNFTFETYQEKFSVDIDYILDDKETYNVFIYHRKGIDNLNMPLDQLEGLIKGRWAVFPKRKIIFSHFNDPLQMKHSFYSKLSEQEYSFSDLKYIKDTYKRFNKPTIVLSIFVVISLSSAFIFKSNIAFFSSMFIALSLLICSIAPGWFVGNYENYLLKKDGKKNRITDQKYKVSDRLKVELQELGWKNIGLDEDGHLIGNHDVHGNGMLINKYVKIHIDEQIK